ncbi:hypothetical protein ACLMJK_007992 [Lecanora helva]
MAIDQSELWLQALLNQSTTGGNYTEYARAPNNLDERVAKDTISIDPALALPNKSLARRQAFQKLQNRYFRQILYGCSNPHCRTPTCLSNRRRLSSKPLRPYTALSARTLASHLASEDHAESGLCPHTLEPEASTRDGTAPVRNQSNSKQRSPDLSLTFQQDEELVIDDRVLCSTTPKSSVEERTVEAGIDHTLEIGASSAQDSVKNESNVNDVEATGKPDIEHAAKMETLSGPDLVDNKQNINNTNNTGKAQRATKRKDTKSFTQSLFDTFSMKNLSLANDLEGHDTLFKDSRAWGRRDCAVVTDTQRKASINYSASFNAPTAAENGYKKGLNGNDLLGENPSRVVHSDFERVENGYSQSTRLTPDQPQSLSHLSKTNVNGLRLMLLENHPQLFAEHQILRSCGRLDFPSRFSFESQGKFQNYLGLLAFGAQSMNYVLSSPEALMRSFVNCSRENSHMLIHSYSFPAMVSAFRTLREFDFHPSQILSSLFFSVNRIQSPSVQGKDHPTFEANRVTVKDDVDALDDVEASHIAQIAFAAVVASVPKHDIEAISAAAKLRTSSKVVTFDYHIDSPLSQGLVQKVLDTTDAFEDEMALQLVKRLVAAITARSYVNNRCVNESRSPGESESYFRTIMCYIIANNSGAISDTHNRSPPSLRGEKLVTRHFETITTPEMEQCLLIMILWLQTLVIKDWDGKPKVLKVGTLCGAIELLRALYVCSRCDIEPATYRIPFLSERLDLLVTPKEWANSNDSGCKDESLVHLLSYPFLFPASVRISYFRAINYDAMRNAYEGSNLAEKFMPKMDFSNPHTSRGALRLTEPLQRAKSHYLVLNVRREDLLSDAMDQLWRRSRSELMRPLKVQIGKSRGEEGVDYGGVQQEFFRVAIAEALEPIYGAFTTDPKTHMSWFQPKSLEPLYKFEMLGLLTSLAIYNGLTLPFSFPLALYRSLLGLHAIKISHIQDGWPDLARGLQLLQDWPLDNVEEVFCRSYVFSMDVFGSKIDVNMYKASKGELHSAQEAATLSRSVTTDTLDHSPPLSRTRTETNMVTNQNREQYIHDYIHYLTEEAVKDQKRAFESGFFTCISRKSISLFSPTELKDLVEGLPSIDVSTLESVTKYETPFHPEHPTIEFFWAVLRAWPQKRVRKLLEFVTASDRLPMGGLQRLTFLIQRNGDESSNRLPSSATCFGRLLLPEYRSKDKLRRDLEIAIANSKGFGQP